MQTRTSYQTILENTRGHVWKTDTNFGIAALGYIDLFAMAAEYHNGPVCANCHYSFCINCEDGPQEDCSSPALAGNFAVIATEHILKAPK